MRSSLLSLLLLPTLSLLALASPVPPAAVIKGVAPALKGPARLDRAILPPVAAVGSQQREGKNAVVGGEEKTVNYLVTLSRTVTNIDKDNIFDFLMQSGAVVKQVYDYRVYKGVLFSVPTVADKGLSSWSTRLEKLVGVKGVEEDNLVKAN